MTRRLTLNFFAALLTIGSITLLTNNREGVIAQQHETTITGQTTRPQESLIAQSEDSDVYRTPQPDREGEFLGNIGHQFWTVVDPDLEGLSCRWSSEVPEEGATPNAVQPDRDFQNWPVVRTFDYGTVLSASGNPGGFTVMHDDRNLRWLKVYLGSDNQICLVRANARFILPLPTTTMTAF